jgi:phage shock protein A
LKNKEITEKYETYSKRAVAKINDLNDFNTRVYEELKQNKSIIEELTKNNEKLTEKCKKVKEIKRLMKRKIQTIFMNHSNDLKKQIDSFSEEIEENFGVSTNRFDERYQPVCKKTK